MGRILKKYAKRLALTVFILAAGCSYSCGWRHKGQPLSQIQESADDRGEGGGGEEDLIDEASVYLTAGDDESEGPAEREKSLPSCFVHVCGEVENPGVYELKEGQRVYEAVNLAGGFTSRAAQSYLNLAEPVRDGMKLEVPNQDQAPEPEWTKPAGGQSLRLR